MIGGLSAALAARGHRVRVVTLDRSVHSGKVLAGDAHQGVEYRRVRKIGWGRYPFAAGLIRHIRGFDVCHIHGLDGLGHQIVASRGRHRVPIVLSTHGGYFHTRRWMTAKKLLLRTGTRWTLRGVQEVWYTSQADREKMVGARVGGRVVANGHDLSPFLEREPAPQAGHWLVAGRVAPHKGLEDLIDTLALLPTHARPTHLHFVGRDDEGRLPSVMRRAKAKGVDGCFAHGEVSREELTSWLSRCERAVFPSRYEGYGLGVLEALAAGVPVVVSDIAAHRAHVSGAGVGCLVPFDRPQAAVERLLSFTTGGEDPSLGRAYAKMQDWSARIHTYEQGYRGVRGWD